MTTHKLAFHLDEWDKDVYSGRQIDLDAYRYACKAFDVHQVAIINPKKIKFTFNDESISFNEFDSFEEFEETYKDEKITIVEVPWSAPADASILGKDKSLLDDGWFVLGPANGWSKHPTGHSWVTIKQNGRGALHGQHVASLLLGFLFLSRSKKGK